MSGPVVFVGAVVIVHQDAAGGWVARMWAPVVEDFFQRRPLPQERAAAEVEDFFQSADPAPLVYDGDDAESSLKFKELSPPPPALPLEQLVAAALRGVWRATNGR